jgi:hypothetical protein
MRSKKQRFAFQTFTETPTTTPSILRFGISHQPHEGGDGAKCGAKFADTLCVIYLEVTSASQIRKEPGSESRQTKGHDLEMVVKVKIKSC